jgi:hypothetical protein
MRGETTMSEYTISVQDGSDWLFAASGDTANGCFADLPANVLEMADAGQAGEVKGDDGRTYRVEAAQ